MKKKFRSDEPTQSPSQECVCACDRERVFPLSAGGGLLLGAAAQDGQRTSEDQRAAPARHTEEDRVGQEVGPRGLQNKSTRPGAPWTTGELIEKTRRRGHGAVSVTSCPSSSQTDGVTLPAFVRQSTFL